VRDPRLSGSPESGAPLAIVGHGSADLRFAATVEAVAERVRQLRPGLEVRVGFLEHGPPHVADVSAGAVVVPLLLASGYHVLVDLPAQAAGGRVTAAVGPDPRLAEALADRLVEAGYVAGGPVVLAAAGSADERARADVRWAAEQLADRLGVEVTAAFVAGGDPRLADLRPDTVAAYLVAPGAFHDACRTVGARVVSEPLGDHPAVAAVVLARYDEAVAGEAGRDQVPGRTAPA
jgi:sirohydrochlorin ferrochelatase